MPFFCPDVPPLTRNPVFLFYEDRFQKPNPFSADIVVGIDDVIEKKLAAVEALESQFYEGGAATARRAGCPRTPRARRRARRRSAIGSTTASRPPPTSFRPQLAEWYGPRGGGKIKYAEAFEICEYGRMPSKDEIRKLFPFFGAAGSR